MFFTVLTEVYRTASSAFTILDFSRAYRPTFTQDPHATLPYAAKASTNNEMMGHNEIMSPLSRMVSLVVYLCSQPPYQPQAGPTVFFQNIVKQ